MLVQQVERRVTNGRRRRSVCQLVMGRMEGLSLRIAVLLAFAASLAAQAAVVSGRVTDPQGKAVAGAAVKLVLPDNSALAETRTDDAGQYSFPDVVLGA